MTSEEVAAPTARAMSSRASSMRMRAACPTACRAEGLARRASSLDPRSEEHTSELQSRFDLVCRLLLEKKKNARCRVVVAIQPGDRQERQHLTEEHDT